MAEDAGVPRTREAIRAYHLERLNAALRRPGMYGSETGIRLLMDAMAFVDGQDEAWLRELDELQHLGLFTSQGVPGAFRLVFPGDRQDETAASVYAEFAHRHGWLTLDGALSGEEYDRVRQEAMSMAARDSFLSEALTSFGPPSVWFGGTNPLYPKTISYVTSDPATIPVTLHYWNEADHTGDAEGPSVHPEPVLLAVRHGRGRFLDTLTFTPEGQARRP